MRKDIIEECLTQRHITLDESVKWTNDKMIKRLGDHTIEHSFQKQFCWGQRYLQSLETVQLCRHLKDEIKHFDKAKIDPWTSPDYVAEFKENGSRVFVYYDPAIGFKMFSRRESVTTFLNNDFTDKILFIEKGLISEPSDYIGKFNHRFILDGEITVDSGNCTFEGVQYENIEDLMQAMLGSLPARAKQFQKEGNRFIFNMFDCIFYENAPTGPAPEVKFDYHASDKDLSQEEIEWVEAQFHDYLKSSCFKGYSSAKLLYRYLITLRNTIKGDIRRAPFSKRRTIRNKLVEFLQSKNLPFVVVDGEDVDKRQYLDDVLGHKCEGIILKNLHAPYISALKSSRSHRACMKVKQSITELMATQDMKDDFDVFITGINKPKSDRIKDMIGSLKCSVYVNDNGTTSIHEIANVSGIPHSWKKEFASFDENGEMILNPKYYGKVIAINGMALTNKLKFQHAVLHSIYDDDIVFKDKNPDSCVWERSALEDMVITRGF